MYDMIGDVSGRDLWLFTPLIENEYCEQENIGPAGNRTIVVHVKKRVLFKGSVNAIAILGQTQDGTT